MGSQPLRIGILQFTPYHGRPDLSRQKVEKLCSSLVPGSLDLLVAPEMALTGYVFKRLEEVEALCEEVKLEHSSSAGTTISLAQALSKRLRCYTIMGFPEVVKSLIDSPLVKKDLQPSPPFDARPAPTSPSPPPAFPAYYNSAILTSPSGSILHSFRKHFLFETDESWSSPGSGFQFIDLPEPVGRLAVAICMDLNPHGFQTEWEKMELSRFCDEEAVDVLVMPMAWLGGKAVGSKEEETQVGEEVNLKVVNYWAERCQPLWEKKASGQGEAKKTLLITSNRTGREGALNFAGSSSILLFEHGKRPQLLACMGETREGLLQWNGKQDEEEV